MFYPLKFKPVYKDYIWGGRNFEKLGKTLPSGIVAESWEVSCHPDGMSIVSNGEFEGTTLTRLIEKYGRSIIGTALPDKDIAKFPLLVKFIDANDDLSVQVHPDDDYAQIHENGEYGKNEMWYIMSAKPGSRLIYDVIPGTTREMLSKAIEENNIESHLKYIEVYPGDIINIPAGLIHAIGKGIMLAEIQQNSNTTYRVYDFNRMDKNGNRRPLHIEKALDVIDFNADGRKEKYNGLKIQICSGCSKKIIVANNYFAVELYDIHGKVNENADGSRFYIYTLTEGAGRIIYETGCESLKAGESVLIPAAMGLYTMEGDFQALKAYVPDIERNVIIPLKEAGYTIDKIYKNVAGLHIY